MNKQLQKLVLIAAMLLLVPPLAAANPLQVTVKNVCYSTDLFHWTVRADMPFWYEEGVSLLPHKNIMIAEVWTPKSKKIENIVFLSAGQQGMLLFPWGQSSLPTGQPDDWRTDGWNRSASLSATLMSASLAGAIITDPARYGFDPSNTLLVLAFDSGFNYLTTWANKEKIVNAYLRYLASKAAGYEYRVRRILMAGASRGGALVTWLARGFMTSYPFASQFAKAKIEVITFDGVANWKQRAVGILGKWVRERNPKRLLSYAYKANLFTYFGFNQPTFAANRKRFSMLQLIGGYSTRPVPGLINKRAFIADWKGQVDNYDDWYGRVWVRLKHKTLCQEDLPETLGLAKRWLTGARSDGWGYVTRTKLAWVTVNKRYRHWYWKKRSSKKWWQTWWYLTWEWRTKQVQRLRFVQYKSRERTEIRPWSLYSDQRRETWND